MTGNRGFDFSHTDVIRMAAETGIVIFRIYEALGIPPDSRSQQFLDACANAKGVKDWADAMNARFDYTLEMSGIQKKIHHDIVPIDPDSDEGKRLKEIFESGDGTRLGMLPSTNLSAKRVSTGIPWGTQEQADRTLAEASKMVAPEELIELYNRTPGGIEERAIIIRELARRFFQK